jgi:cation:H+ antiporter
MTLLPLLAIVGGLAALVWSADRFVSGAAGLAYAFGMPPLLIGMLVVGFGTSAPEMLVSAIAAIEGRPGLALGNAYGSNIANIGLILGLTALISPIAVHSAVLKREVPILLAVTLLSAVLLWDLAFSRLDALVLLAVFAALVFWSIRQSSPGDALGEQTERERTAAPPPGRAAIWAIIGLVALVLSSQVLVWGAVETAKALGVSDLVIGLTVVAVGTSLPELASSLVAIRRKEHDIALGNVIGSNLFNTLAVVGIAGMIKGFDVPPAVLTRDLPFMTALTLALVFICAGFGRQGRVNRVEGGFLLAAWVGYTAYLAVTAG